MTNGTSATPTKPTATLKAEPETHQLFVRFEANDCNSCKRRGDVLIIATPSNGLRLCHECFGELRGLADRSVLAFVTTNRCWPVIA